MIGEALRAELGPHVGRIERIVPVGGGCIANAARIDADGGRFFLKTASGPAGATFEAEAAGLRALRAAAEGTGLCVPRVLHARDGAPGVLLLEWIDEAPRTSAHGRRLGAALAGLHRKEPPGGGAYGFDRDNFIGRLPQQNGWLDDWPAFFRERRLAPQIALARRNGRWSARWDRPAERLLDRLGDLLPHRPVPSLLHGDLWAGNQLADAQGRPWIVDPAAYVGDRETDLAMTELFGRFDAAFYDAYCEAWPLDPGYEERRPIYDLYHLLNHLNHFGSAYAGEVERTLFRLC